MTDLFFLCHKCSGKLACTPTLSTAIRSYVQIIITVRMPMSALGLQASVSCAILFLGDGLKVLRVYTTYPPGTSGPRPNLEVFEQSGRIRKSSDALHGTCRLRKRQDIRTFFSC